MEPYALKARCKRWLVPVLFAVLLAINATAVLSFGAQTTVVPRVLYGAEMLPVLSRYYKVVDLAFPCRTLREKALDFLLALTYLPAFKNEFQIVISKRLGGGYTVTYYSLPAGSKSISDQMFGPEAGPNLHATAEEVAKRIKVDVRNVPVPVDLVSNLIHQLGSMNTRFSLPAASKVLVDASEYHFWFQAAYNPEHYCVWLKSADYGHDQHAQPLVRWMNELRALVEKYANSQDAGIKSP